MIWIRFFFHNEKGQCEDLLHKDIHIFAYKDYKKNHLGIILNQTMTRCQNN